MSAATLNRTLEIRLKKLRLSKQWVAEQMRLNGEHISPWQIYNAGISGRMEESRAKETLMRCHAVLDDYESRMCR